MVVLSAECQPEARGPLGLRGRCRRGGTKEETAPRSSSVSSVRLLCATRQGLQGAFSPQGPGCERGQPPSLLLNRRCCCAETLAVRRTRCPGQAGCGNGILEKSARILSFPLPVAQLCLCELQTLVPALFLGLMRSQVAFGEPLVEQDFLVHTRDEDGLVSCTCRHRGGRLDSVSCRLALPVASGRAGVAS